MTILHSSLTTRLLNLHKRGKMEDTGNLNFMDDTITCACNTSFFHVAVQPCVSRLIKTCRDTVDLELFFKYQKLKLSRVRELVKKWMWMHLACFQGRHPKLTMHETMGVLSRSFSNRLLHPQYCRSFIPLESDCTTPPHLHVFGLCIM